MQCWKCGEQTVGGICTLCGCRESDRKPAVSPAGKVLRYVYDKFGAKRTLTEEGLLVRCLGDVLPEEIELSRTLTAAFAAGAGREFYAVLESNQPLNDASFQGLVRALQAVGLSERDAHTVLVTLWDMAGCGAPAVSQPVPPQPVPQTVPARQVERSKYQAVQGEHPRKQAEQPWQTPAPKPVQDSVDDMRWHDMLCKVVWWMVAVFGFMMLILLIGSHPFMFLFDSPPFEGMVSTEMFAMRTAITVIFLVWGVMMRKQLVEFKAKAYHHVTVYLAVVGLMNVLHIIDWYNSSSIQSDFEYYRLGITGYEELTAFVWTYRIYCVLDMCVLAFAVYTWWYYKDAKRRALFDQK